MKNLLEMLRKFRLRNFGYFFYKKLLRVCRHVTCQSAVADPPEIYSPDACLTYPGKHSFRQSIFVNIVRTVYFDNKTKNVC